MEFRKCAWAMGLACALFASLIIFLLWEIVGPFLSITTGIIFLLGIGWGMFVLFILLAAREKDKELEATKS